MLEKRALNAAMISLSIFSVIWSILILLAAVYCEEISYEIANGFFGRIPSDVRTLLIACGEMVLNLVFAVSAGIFLAECYRRNFLPIKKWMAYLISFGSLIVPIPGLFFIALGIPCFKTAKKSPKWLWLAVISAVIAMPAAGKLVDNTTLSHILFYGMAVLYVLMLFLLNSLAEEKVSRKIWYIVIGFSTLSVAVWGIILGYRIHLQTQISKLEAAFKANGIPCSREEFDWYLARGKTYNVDTAGFLAVLKKIKEKNDKKEDFSGYMADFEKYSSENHLLEEENFRRPLFNRTHPYFSVFTEISDWYSLRMRSAKNAEELIGLFLLSNRLIKFLSDSDVAVLIGSRIIKANLQAFAGNAGRFQLTETQKTMALNELQRLEKEQHFLYSRAALYLPMLVMDLADSIACGEPVDMEGWNFLKMHPVAGAPFICFILKSKLYARGYVDLITRKYNVYQDHDRLPKERFLPSEKVFRKNLLAAMAIVPDVHETLLIRKKYEVIRLIRSLAGRISGKPQTDPFTGKEIRESIGQSGNKGE